MFKKKFFSFGVLIVLIIAVVITVAILIVLASVPAVNNAGTGSSLQAGSGDTEEEEEELPSPVISEWELPIVVSITGADSSMGLAAAWGFDYGIKVLNEMGGIQGIPVRISVRDAASSIAEVTSEIEALTPDALAIMGPPTEAAYKAGGQAFFNARMPAIGAAIDASNRSVYQPFAISCITDPSAITQGIIETWLSIDEFATVCIIYSPLNSERVESIETALTSEEIEIVEMIEIGNEAFDAATVADKAYASGAEAFYIDMNGEDTFRIVAQLRYIAEDDTNSRTILCGPLAADKELIETAPEGELEGIRVWTTLDPGKEAEKRRAFSEAFDKNVGDLAYRSLAVDYYQSAFMLKQAIETLALISDPDALPDEREILANWLFNSESIHTDQGDFFVLDGGKIIETKLYTITGKSLQ